MEKTAGIELDCWIAAGLNLWLFLDYDGTLAEFPPRADQVKVRPEIVSLIRQLSSHSHIRVTVISGRKLSVLQELLPLPGIFYAGVYGVEMKTPAGEVIHQVDFGVIRPFLEKLKLCWEKLLVSRKGFFLEDKDWSLALHGHSGDDDLSNEIINTARQIAEVDLPAGLFRWFAGRNYLELAPLQSHKGRAVSYLFNKFPLNDVRLVYIGDDDKDLEAFEHVHTLGGVNILVKGQANPAQPGIADYIMDSPQSVRQWLDDLPQREQSLE